MTHNQTIRLSYLRVIQVLPATGNEFVINIKDTSVLNVISVVTLFLRKYQQHKLGQYFPPFYHIIAVIYFVLTLYQTRILAAIERRMDMDIYTTGAKSKCNGGFEKWQAILKSNTSKIIWANEVKRHFSHRP